MLSLLAEFECERRSDLSESSKFIHIYPSAFADQAPSSESHQQCSSSATPQSSPRYTVGMRTNRSTTSQAASARPSHCSTCRLRSSMRIFEKLLLGRVSCDILFRLLNAFFVLVMVTDKGRLEGDEHCRFHDQCEENGTTYR